MRSMTLFDVSELSGSRPPTHDPGADAEETERAHAGGHDRRGGRRRGPRPRSRSAISARRKKTSEAKWVGGRIVVSLPAHLDVESRQKTIDWLVDRLLTRHRLARPDSATTSSSPAPSR